MKCRILEHKRSILNNNSTSGFSDHCIKENHFLDINNVKILHSQGKGKILDYLEILEIKKAQKLYKNVTNEQVDFQISPLLKAVI